MSCEFVGDFATVLVYPDESVKCAHVASGTKTKEGKRKLKGCKWPDCRLVHESRERALAM